MVNPLVTLNRSLLTQMSLLAGKPYQGIATMTYTRWHTRPSQKDLARVVYPLDNKSLTVRQQMVPPCNGKTLYVKFTESRQREPCWNFRAVCED